MKGGLDAKNLILVIVLASFGIRFFNYCRVVSLDILKVFHLCIPSFSHKVKQFPIFCIFENGHKVNEAK